jgi:hypothetical protein
MSYFFNIIFTKLKYLDPLEEKAGIALKSLIYCPLHRYFS